MKTVSKILAWVFLSVLFLAALALIVVVLADGLQGEFVVMMDGELITSPHTARRFLRGNTYRFDVGYLMERDSEENPQEYSVKVVANTGAEIEFWVGGEPYAWQGEEDITKAFSIEKDEEGFTLSVPKEITFQTVVQKLYPVEEITAPQEYTLKELYPYTLVVSSYDGKTAYSIDFNFYSGAYSIALKVVPESYAQYVNFHCPQEAEGGDRVEFSFYHGEGLPENAPHMVLEGVFLITGDNAENAKALFCSLQFIYSFDMPFSDVTVELRFVPE